MTPRRLHFWVPEWSGPGGIQAYSRNLVRACAAELRDTRISVFVRNGLFERGDLPLDGCTAGAVPIPARKLAYALMLAERTVTQRPDLVLITHLHFAPIARFLQRFRRFRYWVVAHGIEAWSGLSRARREGLCHAEKILPVSHHTAAQLCLSLGKGAPPMERLPNMVDETVFTPGPKPAHLLRRYGFNEDDRILLTVARLDPRQRYKGCDQVLEALVRVRREMPNVRYVIAGRGADSSRLRRRAQELGVRDSVVVTGFVPESDLRDHFRLCDLFVMPSQAEGFGIVFLEALACGRRVVAGNLDGSAEPLMHGKLGTLVDPNDPALLAETLLRLLHEPAAKEEAEFLRRTVIDHFGAQAFRRRLREVLN